MKILFQATVMKELIPKLKIESPNFKFPITNRVSGYEICSEILIDVRNKLGFGMGSNFKFTIKFFVNGNYIQRFKGRIWNKFLGITQSCLFK